MKSISTRGLLTLLPVILVSTLMLTLFSYVKSQSIIEKKFTENMNITLQQEVQLIQSELDKNASIAKGIAMYVTSSTTEMIENGVYKDFIMKMLITNSNTLGGGIWYEPYKLRSDLQYFGPYVYKDNNSLIYTEEYANSDYDYPSTDWYVAGKNSFGEIAWTDVYYDAISDNVMLTGAYPFYNDKKEFLGTTTADMVLESIQDLVRSVSVGKTGSAFLISANGQYIYFADEEKVVKEIHIDEDSDANLAKLGTEMLANKNGKSSAVLSGKKYQIYYNSIPETNWILAIQITQKELNADTNALVTIMIGITLFSLIVMCLSVLVFVRYIKQCIQKINNFASSASSGVTSGSLDWSSKDEFGVMAVNLNKMITNMGDLNKDLQGVLQKNQNLFSEIENSSQIVLKGSDKITGAVNHLTEESSRQSQSAEQLSDSVINILSIAENCSKEAMEAAKLSDSVKASAQTSEVQMGNMIKAVDDITDSSASISKVIKSIDEIAFQTNILALNAAVEAARAGQFGKGFAVVAEEVRNLASKSAQAAKETSELIADSVEKAAYGSKIAHDTADSLNTIIQGINKNTEIINNINDSNQQQANAMREIRHKVEEITNIINDNFQTANMVSDSVLDINLQSQALSDLIVNQNRE